MELHCVCRCRESVGRGGGAVVCMTRSGVHGGSKETCASCGGAQVGQKKGKLS